MVLRKDITSLIKDLLKKNPQGLSVTEIVCATGINRNTAGRYLENLLVSGQVDMRRFGMAKIYVLSQRVPLSAVLSISSELVIQLDNNLRIIFTNEPFLDFIGSEENEILGKNIEYTPVTTVFDEYFTMLIEHIRKGIAGREWYGEIPLTTRNIILFCRIAPTVFDNGRRGVSVILEDITKQKQAEKKVQESEDRYRKLVEISPEPVFLHGDGKIIYANPAAFNLLGASHSDELIGKNIFDFIQPEFRGDVRKNIEKDLVGLPTPTTELHMVRIDGRIITVEGKGVKTNIDGRPAIQVAIRDITKQKQTEEILKKSEEMYRSLVETTGTGYVIIDKAGRVISANQEYIRLTGRSSLAEIEGRSVIDWTASYDIERNAWEIEQVFKNGQVRNLEIDYQRPDGSIQPIEINASVIRYDSDLIVLTLCRDIGERKRTEMALRDSEATARALINAPTDSVILIDNKGTVLAINEIAASKFGKRSEDLIGTMSYNLLPKDVAHLRRELMAPVVEKKESVRFVDERAGRWYDTVAYPILNEAGDAKKIAIIARDITEQKNIENQLRKSEQLYQRLLEQSFDAIAIHKDKKIVFLNERAAEILGGASPEELIGRHIFDLIHPDSRVDLEERLRNLSLAEDMPVPIIMEKFFRVNGTVVTVEIMAIRFDDNGTPAIKVAFREIVPPVDR